MATPTKTIQASVSISIGGVNQSLNVPSYQEVAAGNNCFLAPQSIISGAWTSISFGACNPADFVMIVNNDLVNYVQIAIDNAGAHIISKIKAGKFIILRLDPSNTALWAEANTATCIIQVIACEN